MFNILIAAFVVGMASYVGKTMFSKSKLFRIKPKKPIEERLMSQKEIEETFFIPVCPHIKVGDILEILSGKMFFSACPFCGGDRWLCGYQGAIDGSKIGKNYIQQIVALCSKSTTLNTKIAKLHKATEIKPVEKPKNIYKVGDILKNVDPQRCTYPKECPFCAAECVFIGCGKTIFKCGCALSWLRQNGYTAIVSLCPKSVILNTKIATFCPPIRNIKSDDVTKSDNLPIAGKVGDVIWVPKNGSGCPLCGAQNFGIKFICGYSSVYYAEAPNPAEGVMVKITSDCKNLDKIKLAILAGKDKPTVGINFNGGKYWKNKNGQYHRLDGPAMEYDNGEKHWYQNGERHREDGPAIEYPDGTKYWYKDGKQYYPDKRLPNEKSNPDNLPLFGVVGDKIWRCETNEKYCPCCNNKLRTKSAKWSWWSCGFKIIHVTQSHNGYVAEITENCRTYIEKSICRLNDTIHKSSKEILRLNPEYIFPNYYNLPLSGPPGALIYAHSGFHVQCPVCNSNQSFNDQLLCGFKAEPMLDKKSGVMLVTHDCSHIKIC